MRLKSECVRCRHTVYGLRALSRCPKCGGEMRVVVTTAGRRV